MRKVLIGVAVVIVLGGIIFANIRAARRKGVEVDVETLRKRNLVAEVEGSGRIEARRSVDIVSNVIGKVLDVPVEEGQHVEKGQVILRIDPAERTALVEQAKAALASARAREELAKTELKQANQELDRMKGLVERGLGSTSDLEKAQTTRDVDAARLASAEQDIKDAQAGVDNAQDQLDRTVVRAEIPGVVVRLAVEKGENVLAGDLYNRGSSIVTVADLSEMEAQVLVDETEVVHIHPGQKATVQVDAFPDRDIAGKVFEVGNSAYEAGALGSQEAKDFRVRILLENFPPTLRPGLSARARIVTDTRDSVLAVPIEALALRDPRKEVEKLEHRPHGSTAKRKTSDRSDPLLARADSAIAAADSAHGKRADEDVTEVEGVFVVKDGKALFTPVKTGIAGKRHFEVLGGVAESTVVVRGPFDALRRLASGDKVRERKEKETTSSKSTGKEGKEDGGGGS